MVIDAGIKKRIEGIIAQKEELKEAQKGIKDSIGMVAEELGVKPAFVSRIISIIEKERSKGGFIADEMEAITTAEKIG